MEWQYEQFACAKALPRRMLAASAKAGILAAMVEMTNTGKTIAEIVGRCVLIRTGLSTRSGRSSPLAIVCLPWFHLIRLDHLIQINPAIPVRPRSVLEVHQSRGVGLEIILNPEPEA